MRHLFFRHLFTLAISVAGSAVLARVLSPDDFGTYSIAAFAVNAFMLFGDLGLNSSFIQKRAAPSGRQLQASFTIQFCLVSIVVLLAWVAAPRIIAFYPNISPGTIWLARSFSLTLYIPVFRSMSMVQLERSLKYKPVAWAETIGIFLYQGVAAIGAVSGFGVWSFVLATLLSGIAGALIVYRAAPCSIRLCFDWAEMRGILRYGISFQAAGLVETVHNWATPVVAGILNGPSAVAFLNLAASNARRPLLMMEAVMRVSFPHFSRLQSDLHKFKDTISDYLAGFLWMMFLWAGFLWTSGAPIIALIYSTKWLPAVHSLMVFAAAVPLDMIIWTMTLSYGAANRNWTGFRILTLRTILNLALAALLVRPFGFAGIAWAYLVSDAVSAGLLLLCFAPGFLSSVARRGWWLSPCLASAYVCGRLSTQILTGSQGAAPHQIIAGSVPYLLVYLLTSLMFAPARYRDRFLHWMRGKFLRSRAPVEG
jgi:PST family polysaccharide transporter